MIWYDIHAYKWVRLSKHLHAGAQFEPLPFHATHVRQLCWGDPVRRRVNGRCSIHWKKSLALTMVMGILPSNTVNVGETWRYGGFTKKCNLTWLTIETWWSYHRKKGIWWDLTGVVLFHDGLWQGQNTGHHSSWRPFFSSNIRDVTTGWIPWSSRFTEVSIVVPKNGWFMSWKIPSKMMIISYSYGFPLGVQCRFVSLLDRIWYMSG